jgi:hypothetical protein
MNNALSPSVLTRLAMSQRPCRASQATVGSLAAFEGPGGDVACVIPGRSPDRHVRPPSPEVAKPIAPALPPK